MGQSADHLIDFWIRCRQCGRELGAKRVVVACRRWRAADPDPIFRGGRAAVNYSQKGGGKITMGSIGVELLSPVIVTSGRRVLEWMRLAMLLDWQREML
jgi:hypothetical protein